MEKFNVFVTVNLPQHKEVAFQLSEIVSLDEAIVRADQQYPTWTSLNLTVLRAETPVGEPA
jgi:hypothetical protein